MNQKGIAAVLIIILMAVLVGGGFYVFKTEFKTEGKFCGGFAGNLPENQCPLGFICKLDGNYPDASGKCINIINSLFKSTRQSSQQATQPISTPSDETTNWKTYTNPEFRYSLKISPHWREAVSTNQQKRFRAYIPDATSSDEIGSFEAELQIRSSFFDDPTAQGYKGEVDKYKAMSTGTEEVTSTSTLKKIKDIDLDGCEATQVFFNEGGYKYGYATACEGKNFYITLLVKADQQSIVEKYKPSYDETLNSLRFSR